MSWKNTTPCAAEWSLISRLSPEAKIAYMCVIRRHVDYRTGIAGGPRRRLYHAMIVDWLSYQRPAGSTLPNVVATINVSRRVIKELEDAGLIVALPAERALMFRLPFIEATEEQTEHRPAATDQNGATMRVPGMMNHRGDTAEQAQPVSKSLRETNTKHARVSYEQPREELDEIPFDPPPEPRAPDPQAVALSERLRDKGVDVKPDNWHLREWLRDGYTEAEYERAIGKTRQAKPEFGWIPPAYLHKALNSARAEIEAERITAQEIKQRALQATRTPERRREPRSTARRDDSMWHPSFKPWRPEPSRPEPVPPSSPTESDILRRHREEMLRLMRRKTPREESAPA